jgi:hypothetical protein
MTSKTRPGAAPRRRKLRKWLPSPRSWYECHVGPLPWHIPGTLASRVRRRWFKFCGRAYDIRWCAVAAVLNRVATDEMRHAALLLGYDLAMGHGREGLLGHLHEHCTGNEIGFGVRYGEAAERDDAAEMMRLECALYGVRRLRYEVHR